MLKIAKIVSGGQTGADQAGLFVARELGIPTGGWAPDGFITSAGPARELLTSYGLREGGSYAERTKKNVADADVTIRLAFDFDSPGEIATLRAAKKFGKPCIDVDLNSPPDPKLVFAKLEAVTFGIPAVINIAGNRDPKDSTRVFDAARDFLRELFAAGEWEIAKTTPSLGSVWG